MIGFAALTPLLDGGFEAIGQMAGMEVNGADQLVWGEMVKPEGIQGAIGSAAEFGHNFNEGAIQVATDISNTIGIDKISGLPEGQKLTPDHFKNDFGMIPRVGGAALEGVQDVDFSEMVDTVFDPKNRTTLITGTAIGGGTIIAANRLIPDTSNNIIDTGIGLARSGAKVVGDSVHAAGNLMKGGAKVVDGTVRTAGHVATSAGHMVNGATKGLNDIVSASQLKPKPTVNAATASHQGKTAPHVSQLGVAT